MASVAALSHLTPVQLASLPVGSAPPNVVSNLINPHSDGTQVVILGSIMMAIMLFFAGLRYYSKIYIAKSLTADDWTTLIAILGTITYYISSIYSVTAGKIGIHMWNISLAAMFSKKNLVALFLVNFLSSVVWLFVKLSFFLLYLKLFYPNQWLRWAIFAGIFVNCAFYMAIIIVTLCYTAPSPGESWQAAFLSPKNAKTQYLPVPISSMSLALDIYILIIPAVGVWNLQLSTKKKLGVLSIFMTGLAACLVSALSIYYKTVLEADYGDFMYTVTPTVTLAVVEMCTGISANCMPSLALLARKKSLNLGTLRLSILRPLRSFRSKLPGTTVSGSANASVSNDVHPRKKAYVEIGKVRQGVESYEMDQARLV